MKRFIFKIIGSKLYKVPAVILLVFGIVYPSVFVVDATLAYNLPVAHGDTYSTPKNTVLTVPASGVLANDTGIEGNTLTAILVKGAFFGTIHLSANGSFSYTPHSGYVGIDTFTYKVNDGTSDSNFATVIIFVIPTYTPPVASNDNYNTLENTQLNIRAPGILANDTDAAGTTITAAKVTNPSDGTIVLRADGSMTYTPNTGYVGIDTFTYKANDGTADSNIATVTITISAPYTPPVANNHTYTTLENTTLTVPAPGILANDTDAADTAITATKVTNPSNGTIVLRADGSMTYTPNTGYVGIDTFTYKTNDGTADSNIATITITVTETPASAGGGAGNGQGGSAIIIRNQPGITNVSSLIDANGTFIQGVTALSDDDQTIVTIESGTNVTTIDGTPVTQISIIPRDDLPNPPKSVNIISQVYDFGPSGATFNPPATINLLYDPKDIPTDVSESNLVIGYYDNKTADWITLASTIDTNTHNVTAQTGHFSLFAVLGGPTANPSIPTTSPSTTIIANIPSSSPIVPANTPSTIAANMQPTPILTTPSVPAAVILSDLNIAPVEIFAGKSITISTVVTNPGKIADTYRVIVSIDNVEISAKDIYLDSGASETVSFNVVQNTAGRHILAINGTQQVLEVRAIPAVITPLWPIWIWIVLSAFAFAFSLSTTVLMGRRRRNRA